VSSLPYAGLGVFLVATAVGIAIAAVRGWAFWKAYKAFQPKLDTAVAETTRLLDALQPRVDRASLTGVRLEEARARLRDSLAVAAVLSGAMSEVNALFRRVTDTVPR
jgi:hypothetical protein